MNLTSPTASVTALIGPNGSGKTTLLEAIVGACPSVGTVQVGECDAATMSRRERAQKIAYVPQGGLGGVSLRVQEVVMLGRLPFGPSRGKVLSSLDEAIVQRAMESVAISHLTTRRCDGLSGGEQQRVSLARAFAQQPQVLLLDEPFNHLDHGSQRTLSRFLIDTASRGVTVLASMHDLNAVSAIASHSVAIRDGEIIGEGSPRELLTEEMIERVFAKKA